MEGEYVFKLWPVENWRMTKKIKAELAVTIEGKSQVFRGWLK